MNEMKNLKWVEIFGAGRIEYITRARLAGNDEVRDDAQVIALVREIDGIVVAFTVSGDCDEFFCKANGSEIDDPTGPVYSDAAMAPAFSYRRKKNAISRMITYGKYGRGHWEMIAGDDEIVKVYIVFFDEQGTEMCSYEIDGNGEIVAIDGETRYRSFHWFMPDTELAETRADMKKVPLGADFVRVFADFCEKWEKEH